MDVTQSRQTDINTLPDSGFRLLTLGTLALVDERGACDQSLARRRRKLAVLTVLAVGRRPVLRERLTEMFWGDEEESRARHSLSDALSSLRHVLGPDSIATRQLEVALSQTCPLAVDALELIEAAERRDHGRVVALYAGPFLDAVDVPYSPSFDRWVAHVRDQLQRHWLDACGAQCLALARARKWAECAILARRWLDTDPKSADAALYLLNALKAPGTAEAYRLALDEYRVLEQRLEREHEQTPAPEVVRLAASVRDELAQMPGPVHPTPAAAPAKPETPPPAPHAPTEPPSRGGFVRRIAHSRFASASFAAMLFLGATSFTARRAASRPVHGPEARPSVAVVDIRNLAGDSASAWLEIGLPRMVASSLARIPGIEVVSTDRVREARRSLGLRRGAGLTRADIVRLGVRSGAVWTMSGGITRGDSLYVLDVTVQASSGTAAPRLFTVTSSSLVALADEVAARLAGLATASGAAPGFAEIETSSLEAYGHYARARQASDEGRQADAVRELDAAIALDSSFASAIAARIPAAFASGETAVVRRLNARLAAALERAAPFDRMRDAADRAMHSGEHRRAESLARALVDRYPHDPRAYAMLADLYTSHGRWDAADSVLERELALDSVSTIAGSRGCAPCVGNSGLSTVRSLRGDMRGAVQAAKRWVELQPDVPGAWNALMATLAFDGQFDAALEAHRRAVSSTPSANYTASLARILVMARRYDDADSVLARAMSSASHGGSRDAIVDVLDVRALLERERGQFRRSVRTVDSAVAVDPGAGVLRFMAANSLARLGDAAAARAIYVPVLAKGAAAEVGRPTAADDARAFAWHHAQLADAIGAVADTVELNALADSIEMVGTRSYYARDWRLAHHVRGLVAMRGGDHARAEREFAAARWGIAGWTVSVVDQARAQLALGRAADAVKTLRDAYAGPLDAMGRYQPRSDIDYWMAIAFQQAGSADSARVYASYVGHAWRDADPEVRRRLDTLPR
jgi:DNA-binding SARP family transcriptional activator/TolB-like protein